MPLESLAVKRPRSPLVIISTGAGVASALSETDRILGSAAGTVAAPRWLHPIDQPLYWRPELADLPLRTYPLNASGIRNLRTISLETDRRPAGAGSGQPHARRDCDDVSG